MRITGFIWFAVLLTLGLAACAPAVPLATPPPPSPVPTATSVAPTAAPTTRLPTPTPEPRIATPTSFLPSPTPVVPTPTPWPKATLPLLLRQVKLATPRAAATPLPAGAAVRDDVLRLREGPGTKHPALDRLEQGDPLPIVGSNEGSIWQTMEWGEPRLASIMKRVKAIEVLPAPRAVAAITARGGGAPAQAAAPLNPSVPPPPPPGNPGATNPLTGLPGDPARLARRPIAVVVNNSPVARPQYGLWAADVVYEYIMDGWYVTRLTAIFYGEVVERIGPVRSARLINEQMTPQYQAALVASGASDKMRYILKHTVHFPYLDVDLDDPCNCTYCFTIGTHWETRLQTKTALLHQWLRRRGQERAPNLNAWPRSEGPPGGAPASQIRIPYPSNSLVDWKYDSASGHYLRSVCGAAHVDSATGQQLSAANVIVLYAYHELTDMVEDKLGARGIRIGLRGSGRVKVLRNGVVIEGTWRGEDPNQPPHFFDAGGREIPLKPGNTWVQVVPTNYDVRVE